MSRRERDEREGGGGGGGGGGGEGGKMKHLNGEGGCRVEEEEGKGWVLG